MESKRIIEKNKRFILHLVHDEQGKEVVAKTLAEDHPSLDSQAQLQNEWKVARGLDHPGLRTVIGESFFDKRKCLLLEFIEGENLKKRDSLDTGAFFRFAIQVSQALQYMHQAGVLHRDISAYNILYNAVTNHYQIIDFGASVKIKDSLQPDSILGTPAYTSPELTGRLQMRPDERADLYSLGVVFYEMLTGGNPFQDASEMQTIYRQIAWLPESPEKIQTAIPITLSRIIMKLLAKDPEHRYRSASSLLYDLEEAQLLFRRNVVPSDFIPGSSETPSPFNEHPDLIAYDKEKAILKGQFNNLLAGISQLSWLTGPEGSGKTALVQHLLPAIYDQQVMYINIGSGSGSAKPYALLFELFEVIFQRINEEAEDQILKRKIRFSAENISDVSFLVDKIPGLSKFVSAKKIEDENGSIQSQNRFQLALQDLLRVLALPERPIIAHFSNSDHIDTESASFFARFVEDVPEEFLWFIFEHSKEDIDHAAHQLKLEGLREEEMKHLFRNMLAGEIRSEGEVFENAKNYAGQNPGKLSKLLRYWHQNGFLVFDHKRNYWFWQKQMEHDLYPGVINWLGKIEDPVEKEVLEWACLIEGNFSLDLLDQLSAYSVTELRDALQALNIKNQILAMRNDSGPEYFKLAARVDSDLLFPEAKEKIARHVSIAKLLHQQESDVYRLAHHVNIAREAGDETFDADLALKINLEAGLKAKGEGAFKLAKKYFVGATQLLTEAKGLDKKTNYTLYLNHAELDSLEGNLESSAKMFEIALANAANTLEIVHVYAKQVTLHNHQGNHEASLASGMKALETLGFPIPRKANYFLLLRKLATMWFKLNRKDPMELLKLPKIKDEKVVLSLRIIEELHAAIFNSSSELLLIVLMISMERILKYGNAPEGYSAYAGFGAVLALGFGNYKKGWAFTLAGAEMANQFNNKMYQGRGLFSKGAWLINYIMHSRQSIEVLEEGIQLSKESGDFAYATNGYTNLQEALFMVAEPFEKMEKKVDEIIAFTFQIGYDDILALSLISKWYCLRMTDRESEMETVIDKWFKGRNLLEYTKESSYKHMRIYYLILDAYWRFYRGEYQEGIEDIKQSKEYLYTLQGPAIIVDYYVIRGLLYYEQHRETKDKKALKQFKRSLSKLKKYAKLVAENFGHRYAMLKALDMYRQGNAYQARQKMREALVLARENEFLQIEGICAVYLARWFLEMDQKDYAKLHFRDALHVYDKWQSPYMVNLLLEEFDFFTVAGSSSTSGSSSGSMSSGHSRFSNPEILMESALNVAAETDFESLLDVMNRIFVEQAGATRSLLFVNSGNELRLLYAMENESKAFHAFPGKEINQIKDIPLSILRLAQRTQEVIIVDDTSKEQRFTFEPYLRNAAAFSIMVTPLLYRGELTGMIYFENKLLTHAFSEKSQEIIQLLSGQFAVALQNARLVEELEHRVKERTLALESEKDRADHLLKNILPVEIAEELKIKGKATSKYHEQVTVMFTDFIGFTKTSEKMHPDVLVKMLDYYFRAFDRITKKYGLEKIKTIGDAYLCVAGLPLFQPKHALLALQAAFEIMDFVNNEASKQEFGLEVRIGLHSGPVVAGVVGEEKFAFDIWGDTVNTASRMESNSQAGKVNITKETMDLVSDSKKYTFTYRGKIKAKNKGEIDMFFVNENQNTIMDHEGAIAWILDKMSNELSEDLHYHSIEHTREIMDNVEKIGKNEGLNEEEMILLSTAAAFHDSGFLFSPEEHEERSAKIAANYLPEYGFSEDQIKAIQSMIRATKIPQQPKDLSAKVLCDADLFYLGTDEFESTGEKLFEEFRIQGIVKNRKDWIALQIRFLESHHYHTQTAIKSCEAVKQKHLEKLKKELENLLG
jgi:histidine kinase